MSFYDKGSHTVNGYILFKMAAYYKQLALGLKSIPKYGSNKILILIFELIRYKD